jgi:fatty acid amide hydrolase 2
MKHPLFELSAKQLAEKIRQRELSVFEVVQNHFNRLLEVNSQINAVCESFMEASLKKAKEMTEEVYKKNRSDLPPLFGVPFSIKEMIEIQGAHRTGGNVHYRNFIGKKNATVVDRMLLAGAIPIATTNVPELGFWFECTNTIYGTTNNPYDMRRTAGGSSGGEAALIGSGASPLGLGSDIGGSIRMPAAFCGIFGLKPSARSIPLTGHFPFFDDDFQFLKGPSYAHTTMGPMCRKAEDLELMFELLCGSDGTDQETRPKEEILKNKHFFSVPSFKLNQIDVYFLPDPEIHLASPVESEVSEKISQVAQTFLELGCNIYEFPRRFFVESTLLWGHAVKSTKNKKFKELLSPQEEIHFTKEFYKTFRGSGEYTFPALAVAFLEDYLLRKSSSSSEHDLTQDLEKSLARLELMKTQLSDKLKTNAVLIFPVFPRVAPLHNSTFTRPFDYTYSGIFTVLGFPSVSIPVGLNAEGLPLSVQIVASPNCDHLLFRFSEILENLFGGWIQPKK